MIGIVAGVMPPFFHTPTGRLVFVLLVVAGSAAILFGPSPEYILLLTLVPVLMWATEILGPHPMLLGMVLIIASLARIMIMTVENIQTRLEESTETQAMVMAFIDGLIGIVGSDGPEND